MPASRADLSRRHFLRGLGACVAVPAFASLRPARVLAAGQAAGKRLAVTATGAPLRAAFVYFPNGAIPASWWPKQEGPNVPLSRTLQPLEPIKELIQVLGGLNHRTAEGGPDGAGDHARGNGTFLTGVRLKKSATDLRAGISIDQVMARQLGHLTRFPSLELACETARKTGACDSGYSCAYQYNLSWSSPTTPVPPESNPRLVFERLFGAGSPGERHANLKRRRHEQRSILDFVLEDARSMQRRLGSQDQHKLDQYLTGVREVETRIVKAERFGEVHDPSVETPPGVPGRLRRVHPAHVRHARPGVPDRLDAGGDPLARPRRQQPIVRPHRHLRGPSRPDAPPEPPEWIEKVADIDLWYAKQFARFLDKLRADQGRGRTLKGLTPRATSSPSATIGMVSGVTNRW